MRLLFLHAFWPAVLIWIVCACAIFALASNWPLGHLALLLVLGNTLASFWLATTASILASTVAVALFNWFLVPPRFTFHVQLDQDLLLLSTLLCTSTVISALTSRLRHQAQAQAEHAKQAERMQQMALKLQHANSTQAQGHIARDLLQTWLALPVALWLGKDKPDLQHPLFRAWQASQQEPGAIGPGTGRHEALNVRVLPLRAGVERIGTLALGPASPEHSWEGWPLDRLQVLARLLADEVQRLQSAQQAREAEQRLHVQQLRNTLLAAISHDYRTPLATIASAASGLLGTNQDGQIQSTARTILEETEHLHRMTSNTLQMARLDTPDSPLQASWESIEELCGVVLAGARRRHPTRRIQVEVPPHLPLLYCDPVLMVQLLDNLIENALRYSPASQTVDLCARQTDGALQLEVHDRGAGIPQAWREQVFAPFRRVPPESRSDRDTHDTLRRGIGLGLALCQAIARVHQARLWIEDRAGGGTVVCLRFAAQAQPQSAPEVPA